MEQQKHVENTPFKFEMANSCLITHTANNISIHFESYLLQPDEFKSSFSWVFVFLVKLYHPCFIINTTQQPSSQCTSTPEKRLVLYWASRADKNRTLIMTNILSILPTVPDRLKKKITYIMYGEEKAFTSGSMISMTVKSFREEDMKGDGVATMMGEG